ncbi:ABC transporter permease [Nocardioides sp. GXQ0305]|uniref:ABC transporter permease n=1 Tax=Nocardioides sp. GXQ0305 TaxID=3423912 RepID=UPI003D7CFC23
MTTTTDNTSDAPMELDVSATPAVPFTRLVRVELRKALDTRAGRWFTFSIIALCLIVVTIYALAAPDDAQTLGNVLGVSGAVLGYFLPVLVILMLTSEWSQRTGLVTFTLEPHRGRVVASKFVAALLLGAGLIAVAFAVAAFGTVLGGGEWTIDTGVVLVNGFVVANLIGILLGFAIGMLLMNTPAAIVTYFIYSLVLPIAVGILSSFQEWFADLAPWIEFNTAQGSLFTGDPVPTGEELGQLLVSGTIWLVVPFVLGLWRLLRAEPK